MNVLATVEISDELVETFALRLSQLLCLPVDAAGTPWLTAREAADYLRTTEAAIRALVKRNKIPVHRIEGRVLFDRQELDAWVRSGE